MTQESTRPAWYRPASVRQVAYDAGWPALYAEEEARLTSALAPDLVSIEHVGSTAVPGLSSKPIIDILAAVRSWERFGDMVDQLATIGYIYTQHSEADDPGRRVFRKPSDMSATRTHHLHVTEPDSDYWRRIVAFRNALRADTSLATEYAALKTDLAQRFAHDPNAYTSAKSAFVSRVRRAGTSFTLQTSSQPTKTRSAPWF